MACHAYDAAQGIMGPEVFVAVVVTEYVLGKTTTPIRHLWLAFLLRFKQEPFWL